MSAITVANLDWEIVSDAHDALTAATVAGSAVFADVTVTTDSEQAKQCQYTNHPVVVILYQTTAEDDSPEDVRSCVVYLQLIIAAQVAPAKDESPRLKEILRLMNAAKNAIEATPPSDGVAWGDGNMYHARIDWGQPAIDITSRAPWAVCVLPVEFCYVIDTGTSH